ncbi:MAG: hypothetical protein ACLFU8_03210 [Anaerolineales bacterium]
MKHRARFLATLHYEPRDRVPLIDFGFWDETLDVWHEQGLPADVDRSNIHDYLGMDYDFPQVTFATGTDAGLLPPFEEQVLEDRGDQVGTWQSDPVEYRERFGKALRMLGGFDKRILAGERDAIEREVHRLAPLVEEGGYIPFCDHLVPPDVPFENYLFYLELARSVWGKGIDLQFQGLSTPPPEGASCEQ